MNTLAAVAFLSVANKAIIDAIFIPIQKRFPNLDTWWLIYVSWVTGALISYLCEVNLFSTFIPSMLTTAGLIITAVVVGGGSNLVDKLSNLMGSVDKK